MSSLQREHGTAILMITHDLGVVAQVADRVITMYGGRIVERGARGEVLARPHHPYTRGLLASVPRVGSERTVLQSIPGNPPSLLNPPPGCLFHPRCAHTDKVPGNLCSTELPDLLPGSRGPGHVKRCHLANPDEVYRTEVLPEIAPELVEEK
jgi:peptide/nickel transport system ATP-binding protein